MCPRFSKGSVLSADRHDLGRSTARLRLSIQSRRGAQPGEACSQGSEKGRVAAPTKTTFDDVFAEYQDTRSISERTREHERHLRDRHLQELRDRRVQDVSAGEIAKVLRGMRETYSPWTQVAVYRIIAGTFGLAVRRGIVTRTPSTD